VIIYYLILSQVLIKNDKHILYFFKTFEKVFVFAVALGVVALIVSMFEVQLFSRQYNYGEGVYIGVRFHGIFGEPRDAAVSLIFSLAIFNLKNIYCRKSKLNYKYILLVLFLVVMTVSGSLAITLFLFTPLYVLFSRNRLKLVNIKIIIIFSLVIFILYLYVLYNNRLLLYYEQILLIPEMIENGIRIPYHVRNQIVNIYPFWLTYMKIINFDIFSLIFGSGLGVNAIEKYPMGPYDFGTAHSQIPRLILETGVAGFLLWCFMLFHYVRKFRYILNDRQWRTLLFYFVLVCSAALAHRSHLVYIYVGITFSVYNILNRRISIKNA